jgi:hypothetical protein
MAHAERQFGGVLDRCYFRNTPTEFSPVIWDPNTTYPVSSFPSFLPSCGELILSARGTLYIPAPFPDSANAMAQDPLKAVQTCQTAYRCVLYGRQGRKGARGDVTGRAEEAGGRCTEDRYPRIWSATGEAADVCESLVDAVLYRFFMEGICTPI